MTATSVGRPGVPAQFVGAGATASAVAQLGARRLGVVVDGNVADRIPAALRMSAATICTVVRPVDRDDVAETAAAWRRECVDGVVVIGGGNAMDLAKLAAGCAGDERLLAYLDAQASSAGFVLVPAALWRPLPLVSVPTTFGTGAEVSSVACWESGAGMERAKSIATLPSTPTLSAAYEPRMLAAPGALIRASSAEAWSRIIGAYATPSTLSGADAEAEALGCRTARIAAALLPGTRSAGALRGDVLVDAALASAAGHAGWALRGRGLAPFPLWFVANELSMLTRSSKIEALAVLWPDWLRLVDTQAGGPWGQGARVRALLGQAGMTFRDAADLMASLVDTSRLRAVAAQSADVSVRTAERVMRRFGRGRPLSRSIISDEIACLVEDALAGPCDGAPR
ncbi:iron-containing alcohol dehydrogenase [Microbacterium stercoris]|uniref:Iron-containing alcohol dehydrogenase n=1 Tax=Microbacterium stercoris TaxID=2820289 RepID=A0A939TQN6_9MICO|nr:iron-containing alcohol dehydrogenase [Microbacterium stercoris]MBO3663645.1 iron-containing alcohol dehydrogenase [Microbacterium stercoris]